MSPRGGKTVFLLRLTPLPLALSRGEKSMVKKVCETKFLALVVLSCGMCVGSVLLGFNPKEGDKTDQVAIVESSCHSSGVTG